MYIESAINTNKKYNTYTILLSVPRIGGTCSILLFAKSNVANLGKAPNPLSEASIVSILLSRANSISKPTNS